MSATRRATLPPPAPAPAGCVRARRGRVAPPTAPPHAHSQRPHAHHCHVSCLLLGRLVGAADQQRAVKVKKKKNINFWPWHVPIKRHSAASGANTSAREKKSKKKQRKTGIAQVARVAERACVRAYERLCTVTGGGRELRACPRRYRARASGPCLGRRLDGRQRGYVGARARWPPRPPIDRHDVQRIPHEHHVQEPKRRLHVYPSQVETGHARLGLARPARACEGVYVASVGEGVRVQKVCQRVSDTCARVPARAGGRALARIGKSTDASE